MYEVVCPRRFSPSVHVERTSGLATGKELEAEGSPIMEDRANDGRGACHRCRNQPSWLNYHVEYAMEKIEISTANVSLADIVKHVSRDRVTVELSDGQVPMARIVPIDRPQTMSDLDRALRNCARLGEDAEQFADDVLSVRKSIGELDDPWES
jgi:antitoxin (DNA-binding transcriptional repressor) of toxin-antitoxin stability system